MMAEIRTVLKRAASLFKCNSKVFSPLETPVMEAVKISGLGFEADEWVSLTLVLACLALVASTALFCMLLPMLYALCLALATAFSVGLCVYAYPFLIAGKNAKTMEAELPMFIARLLSVYAERKDMVSALKTTIYFYDGKLAERAKNGYVLFLAGVPAEQAFGSLIETPGLRYVNRAFKLIAKSLETGLDVGEALKDVARSASASIEFEAEKESKVGLVSWIISASSAFFFPLFAALGLVVMDVLERIAAVSPYTGSGKSVIQFAVFYYLMVGILFDAGYNGRIKFDSFVKGILVFAAPLCLLAIFVFVFTFKLANLFTGH